jgi:hypothetical protein
VGSSQGVYALTLEVPQLEDDGAAGAASPSFKLVFQVEGVAAARAGGRRRRAAHWQYIIESGMLHFTSAGN